MVHIRAVSPPFPAGVCEAEEIVIELNGTEWKAGYGTTRTDTQEPCGDVDNGFSLLHNWNLLGDGIHAVKAYADGVLFASTQVKVTTLGREFLRGAEFKEYFHFTPFNDVDRFYMAAHLEWWETGSELCDCRFLRLCFVSIFVR